MSYDVFISYRHEGGFMMAQIVKDQLTARGLSCFFDSALSAGTFDDKLLEAIDEAPNFVIILAKGTLERCVNEDDWVRREIVHAVSRGKDIIPLLGEGFDWPFKDGREYPPEILSLDRYNGVPFSRVYLDAMVDKLISFMTGVNVSAGTGRKQRMDLGQVINIGTSNLTVVDSIMQGWECERVFADLGCTVEKHPYKWSDRVLKQLSSGAIDMAIYNKESTLRYIAEHGDGIKILRDVCSSMGGRNFYILASRFGRWRNMTLETFKENLDSTVVIGVAKGSDMYRNLLYVLDYTEEELAATGVKIMDYHSDQGLDMFAFMPDLLIIAGQDIRFLAQQTGDYFEIISYDDFPGEKKKVFFKNSVNSLIIGPKGQEKLQGVDLSELATELMVNFYKNAMDPGSLKVIKENLSRQLSNICDDDEVIDYITSQIIFETYRFM